MTLLDFNELREGQQIGIQSTDRGVISGTAVPATTGASIGFIDAGAGAQSFNGNGSAGANALSAITTIRRNIAATTVVWNFLPAGVATGALVFLNVTGFNAGNLTIQNNGVDLLTIDDTSPAFTTQNPQFAPFPILFFDGTNWALLFSAIQDT